MPLLHCKECHHEWEGEFHSQCDWCGAESYILEEQTELEKLIHDKDKIKQIIEYVKKLSRRDVLTPGD